MSDNSNVATLGGGCFWCLDAVFVELKGVTEVISGYSGGKEDNPTYEDIGKGKTGHAEAVQVKFDPDIISFKEILEIFFFTHDPTTLNRQGNDIGTQYRSAIFYHSDNQLKIANELIIKLDDEKVYDNPIVTEISKFEKFYRAEAYHQNYFNQNSTQPYCQFVISPKVTKFREKYFDKLK
ncbi:MAG: peptide-methionine (S)-S-oxide reductase MsrA [Candidatus Kariarchaeaceae archaeon]|jgi:peptide-methionine (S)-S-oxide reductase